MPNPAQIANNTQAAVPAANLSPADASALTLDAGQIPVTPNPPVAAPVISPLDAASLGLSGSDSPVPVGETVESTGHVKPSSAEARGDEKQVPDGSPQPVPTGTQSVGPVVAGKAPTVKDMLANVLKNRGGAEGMGAMLTSQPDKDTPTKGEDIDWLGMLKKVVAGGGDFLQTWANGVMHHPEAQTLADTQRAQAFEIQKAQTQNELLQRNMLLDNDYQTKRQALMQTYNVANLTQQAAAERDNRLAELEATYQNEKKLLPQKIAAEMAAYGYGNYQKSGTNPAMTTWGGG